MNKGAVQKLGTVYKSFGCEKLNISYQWDSVQTFPTSKLGNLNYPLSRFIN